MYTKKGRASFTIRISAYYPPRTRTRRCQSGCCSRASLIPRWSWSRRMQRLHSIICITIKKQWPWPSLDGHYIAALHMRRAIGCMPMHGCGAESKMAASYIVHRVEGTIDC